MTIYKKILYDLYQAPKGVVVVLLECGHIGRIPPGVSRTATVLCTLCETGAPTYMRIRRKT